MCNLIFYGPPCLYVTLRSNALDQCFSTAGSRPTFGSRELTFGSPKPVFKNYNCNQWVAKIVIFCLVGRQIPNVENHCFRPDFCPTQLQLYLGSISPTYLRTAFTTVAPKSVRIQSSCQCLFTLLGSTSVKAVLSTLMKLTPDRWMVLPH